MRARAAVLLGALVALVACDAIVEPAASPAPRNTCELVSGSAQCAEFSSATGPVTCGSVGERGACLTGSVGDFLLVVSVPALAPVSAGTTYAVTSQALFGNLAVNVCGVPPTNVPANDQCFKLPALVSAGGIYVVSPAAAAIAGRPVGNTDGASVSLPVTTTFWPQWLAPGAEVASDVRLLNLPLPPINARVGPLNVLAVAAIDPNGGQPIEWQAGLPPLASGYSAIVQVTEPFLDGYPEQSYLAATPVTTINHVARIGTELGASVTLEELPPTGLTVQRADGTALGAGWAVYFRDHTTLQPYSSKVTLGEGQKLARLNVFPVPSEDFDLVLTPPLGASAVPQFIDTTAALVGITVETYPALPPAIRVSGKVRSPFGTAVSASLLFHSALLDDVGSCEASGASPSSQLFYETLVHTDDQLGLGGSVGEFHVELPQGAYSVIVDPTPQSGYAKTTIANLAARGTKHPVCSGASPSLDDAILDVLALQTLSGTVVTADGRPLANASVGFTAAGALAATRFSSPTAVDAWPRPFATTTGEAGGFSIQVDPYGEYDVTVRPEDGSGFPWIVRADHTYAAAALALEPLVVPAPFFLSATLHDPNDNPLASAVIQAYAFHGDVALLIGEAVGDSQGHFTMMLTTSFPSN